MRIFQTNYYLPIQYLRNCKLHLMLCFSIFQKSFCNHRFFHQFRYIKSHNSYYILLFSSKHNNHCISLYFQKYNLKNNHILNYTYSDNYNLSNPYYCKDVYKYLNGYNNATLQQPALYFLSILYHSFYQSKGQKRSHLHYYFL